MKTARKLIAYALFLLSAGGLYGGCRLRGIGRQNSLSDGSNYDRDEETKRYYRS